MTGLPRHLKVFSRCAYRTLARTWSILTKHPGCHRFFSKPMYVHTKRRAFTVCRISNSSTSEIRASDSRALFDDNALFAASCEKAATGRVLARRRNRLRALSRHLRVQLAAGASASIPLRRHVDCAAIHTVDSEECTSDGHRANSYRLHNCFH